MLTGCIVQIILVIAQFVNLIAVVALINFLLLNCTACLIFVFVVIVDYLIESLKPTFCLRIMRIPF